MRGRSGGVGQGYGRQGHNTQERVQETQFAYINISSMELLSDYIKVKSMPLKYVNN